MTRTTINVKTTQIGSTTHIVAKRDDMKPIDIAVFFKPYYAKGLKLKKLHYIINAGFLTATLAS
jgi:hypothetical protein